MTIRTILVVTLATLIANLTPESTATARPNPDRAADKLEASLDQPRLLLREAPGWIPVMREQNDSGAVGRVFLLMAQAYARLGRVPETMSACELALAESGIDVRTRAHALTLLSGFHLWKDDVNTAAEYANVALEALNAARTAPGSSPAPISIQQRVLIAHGNVQIASEELPNALRTYEAAARIGIEYFASAADPLDPREQVDVADQTRRALLSHAQTSLQRDRFEESILLVTRSKSTLKSTGDVPASVAETLAFLRSRVDSRTGKSEVTRQPLADLIESGPPPGSRTRIPHDPRWSWGATAPTIRAEMFAAFARVETDREDPAAAWIALERSRWESFTDTISAPDQFAAEDLAELQSTLTGAKSAVILFNDSMLTEMQAILVTPDSVLSVPIATSVQGMAAIQMQARLVMDGFARGGDAQNFIPGLSILGQFLVQPILPRLPVDCVRLQIVPPSSFARFPFEALGIDYQGELQALGKRYSVSYLPYSTFSSVVSKPRLWAGTPLVAIEDPILTFAESELPSIDSDLRRLRQQLRSVGSHGPHNAVKQDRRVPHDRKPATRDAFLGIVSDEPVVLHISTAGLSTPLASREAELLFAGPNGRVGTSNVEGLGLVTDLVTISGPIPSGELALHGGGEDGMIRAFLRASARSVVYPRWEVPEAASDQFYEELYLALREALPRGEAMQRARARMRELGYPPRIGYAFAHWGAGNLPVYMLSKKDPFSPLVIGWIVFLIPTVVAVWLYRRHRIRTVHRDPSDPDAIL